MEKLGALKVSGKDNEAINFVNEVRPVQEQEWHRILPAEQERNDIQEQIHGVQMQRNGFQEQRNGVFCVCTCAHTCVCVYVCARTCVHACVCACMCVHKCTCMCPQTCIHVHTHVCICTYYGESCLQGR